MIQAKRLRTFLLCATLAACCFSLLAACCLDWLCQPIYQCPNGMFLKICVSPNGTQGGYKVGSQCFPCANYPYDCEDAAQAATAVCYGKVLTEDSSCTDLEGCKTDIEECTGDLLDAMDDLMESY